MKESLAGTYWLVCSCGKRYITQGNKPERSTGESFKRSGKGIGWVCIDDNSFNIIVGNPTLKDFEGVKFPNVTYEESPIEIEIGKSGKVYIYEP